jgi:hypothetical protein
VDVVQPIQQSKGKNLGSCNITLMPWSPFPCRYAPSKAEGVPHQQADYCFNSGSPSGHAKGGDAESLAVNLTTDGYNNLFFGRLPRNLYDLCPGGWDAGEQKVRQLLLTVEFRLASGRQFDRMYSLQIGHAVVSVLASKHWMSGAHQPGKVTVGYGPDTELFP